MAFGNDDCFECGENACNGLRLKMRDDEQQSLGIAVSM